MELIIVCMEAQIKKPEGTPKVFVAGGAGTGVFIYRNYSV